MKNKLLRTIWLISLVLLILKFGFIMYAQYNSDLIEQIYSRGIYLKIANVLTGISNLFAFSLGELIIGLMIGRTIVILTWLVILILKRHREMIIYIFSMITLCLLLLLNYFDISWLLNNYRIDLMTIMNYPNEVINLEDLEATYREAVIKANHLRQSLSEDANGYPNDLNRDEILKTIYKGYKPLKEKYDFIDDQKVIVKGLFTSPIQTMSGYTGIYLFFIGEPTVNINVPVVTLPHTAAHEIAHQKGFALEGDANYIGFLACKAHASEFVKYSGYLAALEYLGNELYKTNPTRYYNITKLYDDKVVNDLVAINEFWRMSRVEKASEVANKINDSYLKSYNQPEGLQSYDKFVELLVADYLSDSEL